MLLLHLANLIITLLMINQLTITNIQGHQELNIGDYVVFSAKGAEEHDPFYQVRCPIEDLVVYTAKGNKTERKRYQNEIFKKIKIKWLKDGEPFSRQNGNKFDDGITDKWTLVLYQFGSSDAGTYTCDIDYSEVPYDLGSRFRLPAGGVFNVLAFQSLPDIEPIVSHPPANLTVKRGANVTFTCNRAETLSSQMMAWFQSCHSLNETMPCVQEFNRAFEEARQKQDYGSMIPYILHDIKDADTLTIVNVTEEKLGYYGCFVYNANGIDIRLGSVNLIEKWVESQLEAREVRALPNQPHGWIWVCVGLGGFLLVGMIIASCICVFQARLQQDKKLGNSPLLSKIIGMDVTSNKDSSSRKRLPTIEAPDIYNTGKSIDGFITGHFHQEAGHILAQSICGNLLNKVNPSISSSNSHQSDEASSSWGKSLSSHHGDNCKAFYSHGSNSTATTVPLYDHPPSTGTLRRCRTFGHDACVSNPSYWLLNPENDTSEWNIPRRNLERMDKIGVGQFGEVWRYRLARSKDRTEIVAVKKLKDELCASDSERSELRAEIEIMKAVKEHPNVIKLLHCCIDQFGPILLIMEYAENGKLQTYLRSCRASRKLFNDTDDQPISRQNVTSKELIKFTYHIAKGMEYVASQGIVHRDLASRNILVSKDKVCKVADFGFARRVDDDCVYVRKSTNPVPVKWMAPEALEGNKFTLKSDVFSLGILMWEIVTLGATPYEDLTSEVVYRKVTSGGRLERPPHCKDEFFALMAQCWMHDPALRPTFKEVAQKLERLLLSENDYIELDQYPEHAYYNIVNAAEKEVVQI